jgi:hypothetical protein
MEPSSPTRWQADASRCKLPLQAHDMAGRADLLVSLVGLSQQLLARHLVPEAGGQLGAQLEQLGRERGCTTAFDQQGGVGKRLLDGMARGRPVSMQQRAPQNTVGLGLVGRTERA